MLPENMALSIIDVLNFHQKQGHFKVPKRTFSAISLRIHTPGKYTYKNKTVSFEPASVCIIPEGLSYERTAYEDDILVIHFNILNFVMEDIEVYKISDAEKYRRLFIRMLGKPLTDYKRSIPRVKSEYIDEDSLCRIYRLQMEILFPEEL